MNDLQIYIQFNNQKREFMKKRLTMFLAVMFLCMGTALAQTKVSGTVLCLLVRTSWRSAISVLCLRMLPLRTVCACS